MPGKKKPRDRSKGMKIPDTKPLISKSQPASVEAGSRSQRKPKGDVSRSVRLSTHFSTSPARQVAFEVASEPLLSLIRSNFDALRARLKKSKDEAQRDRATSGKADEDLTSALNRLEAGYRELLRGI